MSEPIIRAQHVYFQYPDAQTPVVSDVSLDIEQGSFVAILGRNGSGKSTFAKLLNALLVPAKGTVTVCGRSAVTEDDCFAVRADCGMIFQNPDNQIVATIVEEDCAFGLENMGVPPEKIRSRVDRALSDVGMSQYAQKSPAMLSGGQKQRVAIAGVLAMRPKVIVFDESTAMLDPVGRADVLELARRINREEGITIVWITHFMDEVVEADRIIVIDEGSIALQGTPLEVFSQVDTIHALGLEVPEMMALAARLRAKGITLNQDTMTVERMTEEICRLKSKT